MTKANEIEFWMQMARAAFDLIKSSQQAVSFELLNSYLQACDELKLAMNKSDLYEDHQSFNRENDLEGK